MTNEIDLIAPNSAVHFGYMYHINPTSEFPIFYSFLLFSSVFYTHTLMNNPENQSTPYTEKLSARLFQIPTNRS